MTHSASKSAPEPRPAPRLYLITPPVNDPAPFAPQLQAALEAGDVAAVLLRLAPGDEGGLARRIKALASTVQDAGAALLLDGATVLIGRTGADGAHLTGIEAIEADIGTLRPDRIAGAGGLTTRHDAMLAGEADPDYVMFGEPDEAGHSPTFEAVRERVAWWAEVFRVPCIGYAAASTEIGPLAAAGAEFVAVGPWIFDDPRGPGAVIAEAMGELAAAAPAEGVP
jgi:thiamine-phosphate pyrophosphorylase